MRITGLFARIEATAAWGLVAFESSIHLTLPVSATT